MPIFIFIKNSGFRIQDLGFRISILGGELKVILLPPRGIASAEKRGENKSATQRNLCLSAVKDFFGITFNLLPNFEF